MSNEAMSKDLAQYIVELADAAPSITKIGTETGERTYMSYRGKSEEVLPGRVSPLKTHTLSSIVDYIRMPGGPSEWVIHIESHEMVLLKSQPNGVGLHRDCFVIANADVPGFKTDSFHESEAFMIMAMARLFETPGKDDLLRFIGDINEVDEQRVKDNGTGQTITAKSGISTVAETPVPNPVELAPFRTFPDVSQPISPFILRVRKGPKGPEVGIFEADGGAWKSDAIQIIAAHLREALKDYTDCPVYIIA